MRLAPGTLYEALEPPRRARPHRGAPERRSAAPVPAHRGRRVGAARAPRARAAGRRRRALAAGGEVGSCDEPGGEARTAAPALVPAGVAGAVRRRVLRASARGHRGAAAFLVAHVRHRAAWSRLLGSASVASSRLTRGSRRWSRAGTVFVLLGTAIWAQLAIGWQWSRPSTPATTAAIVAMSCLLGVFAALALVGSRAGRSGRSWLGSRPGEGELSQARSRSASPEPSSRFSAPGTSRPAGPEPEATRGRISTCCRGTRPPSRGPGTLSVTSYWAHPGALLGFPPDELLWMVASPVALVAAVAGGARTIRRLELSPRVLRFELALARISRARR